jgi:hypothetical protein
VGTAKRSPLGARREQQRARSTTSYRGADECTTGHPVLFGDPRPAVILDRMPQGGGYPVGLVEFAARVMRCTDLDRVVHLCSGSVRAPLTFDLRPDARPAIVADVRELPIATAAVDWVMVDPPYSREHAQDLWATGHQYPTPAAIFREVARILRPGGRATMLHFLVPRLDRRLRLLDTYGVTLGPGYRIRALTVVERTHDQPTLEEA